MGEVKDEEKNIAISHEIQLTATDVIELLKAKGIPIRDEAEVFFQSDELRRELRIEDDVDDACIVIRWVT